MREKKFCVMVAEEGCEPVVKQWFTVPEGAISLAEHEYRTTTLRGNLAAYVDQWNRELDKNKILTERIQRLETDLQQSNDALRQIENIVCPF